MPVKNSAPAPPTAKPSTLTIDVTPSQEATEALQLRSQATSLVVVDRESHAAALEFVRGAKQLQRRIEEHWSRITRSVDDLKKNLLNLKRQDLAPVEAAIASASNIALTYENAEKRRVDEETERQRAAAQKKADEDRARELKQMEDAALKAEASSPDLSAREVAFVALYCGEAAAAGVTGDARQAAARAGYKDPNAQGERLLAMPKIQKAIIAKRRAMELRTQAAATREKPVEVVVQKVESQLGKAAGVSTRKTYGCDVVDLDKFKAAVVAGVIPTDYILPNGPELNRIAGKGPDLFEQAFPGCKLRVNQTIAG